VLIANEGLPHVMWVEIEVTNLFSAAREIEHGDESTNDHDGRQRADHDAAAP
jgi:hypothetical protein